MHVYWWIWVIFGILMCLAEIMTPSGFYLIFIGLAAILVGVVSYFVDSLVIQLILFSVSFILFILLFRKKCLKSINKKNAQVDDSEFTGEIARTLEAIPVGEEGKIELRGTGWTGCNGGDTDLPSNTECRIVSRDGLKFIVQKK